MKNLLSAKENRQLALLEVLIEKKQCTLSYASQRIGYTERTLSDDVKQINNYIAPSKIITKNNGLSLSIPLYSSSREIYSNFVKYSREYQLLLFLLEHEPKTLEDFADSLYLSASTVKRTISQLNVILQEYNIKIESSSIRLIGDERAISLFYTAILNETNYASNYFLDDTQITILSNLCKLAAKKLHFKLNYPDLIKLVLWTYVRIARICHGHLLNEEEPAKNTAFPFDIEQPLADAFFSLFGIQLDENVMGDIFSFFLHRGYARSMDDIRKIIQASPTHKTIYEQIEKTLRQIASYLGISTDETGDLFVDLFNILQISKVPLFELYSKNKIFNEMFREKNEFIYHAVSSAVSEFFPQLSNENEYHAIVYILLTHWPKLVDRAYETASSVRVGILFDSDVEHAQLVPDILNIDSDIKINIVILSPIPWVEYDSVLQNVDVLVTNIPEFSSVSSAVICVQEYPSEQDSENVSNAIKKQHRINLIS